VRPHSRQPPAAAGTPISEACSSAAKRAWNVFIQKYSSTMPKAAPPARCPAKALCAMSAQK
jgi:hypothetical protein